MSSSSSAEAVVIGGGVIGATTAYALAREGVDVVLLERDGVASGCTGHGHGVISLVGKDFKPGGHFELGLASARMYADFVSGLLETGGRDPMYHELDGISYAILEEEEQIFRAFMERDDTRGQVDMEWLDVDAARELEPRLTRDAIGGVRYRHGQVDGRLLSLSAVDALEQLGGRVLISEATGIAQDGGRVSAVQHREGVLACQIVVIASGAWAFAAGEWLGFPIPVRPYHGEVLQMRLPGKPMEIFVLTARHGPILPRRDGVLLVGSIGGVSMSGLDVDTKHIFDPLDSTPPEFDGVPRDASREHILTQAKRVMPALVDAELLDHLAGVRPLSADRMPLIGAVPGLEGAYLATGHGTKGIHLAPITATIVAELATRGGIQQQVTLEPFLPDRFA